jgi:hypothetical protein
LVLVQDITKTLTKIKNQKRRYRTIALRWRLRWNFIDRWLGPSVNSTIKILYYNSRQAEMARPEGFEPPTPRSVEVYGAGSQGSAKRACLTLLCFRNFSFMLVPTLLAQSGHKHVTGFYTKSGFTSRLVILGLRTTTQQTSTCNALRPACDHNFKRYVTQMSVPFKQGDGNGETVKVPVVRP